MQASKPTVKNPAFLEFPKTLQEAIVTFSNPDLCLKHAIALRWPSGIVCPRCQSVRHSFLSTRRLWKCLDCKKQFSVKVGTIFEDSPITLDKYLDEEVFRFNSRDTNDAGRFTLAGQSVTGKRLTYEELTHGHLTLLER